jgi:hypothetical protein
MGCSAQHPLHRLASGTMRATILLTVTLLLAACTGVPTAGQTPDAAAPATPIPDAGAPTPDTGPPTPDAGAPTIAPDPPQETFPLFDTEVPQQLMEAVVDEAAFLGQVGLGDVRIVRAEAVTWSDASLGCPEEDMMYAQVLTPGYWVVLEAGGQQFDFRASETGTPRLCPEGQGQPPLEGLPD